MEFVSKTQLYLKVKKPLLERQRRARINKCLDALKMLVAEFQGDDAILRMDKAEMLESVTTFMRHHYQQQRQQRQIIHKIKVKNQNVSTTAATATPAVATMDNFRYGYMNAVNEVSRVMAAMPGINVDMGKSVMTHLGCEFNRLLHMQQPIVVQTMINDDDAMTMSSASTHKTISPALFSPASSGYHSDDCDECPITTKTKTTTTTNTRPANSTTPAAAATMWRPW